MEARSTTIPNAVLQMDNTLSGAMETVGRSCARCGESGRGPSGRAPPHSKTLRDISEMAKFRQVLECGCPLPLCRTAIRDRRFKADRTLPLTCVTSDEAQFQHSRSNFIAIKRR